MDETLVHEVLEAIVLQLENDQKITHEQITVIANALFGVLRDNAIAVENMVEKYRFERQAPES